MKKAIELLMRLSERKEVKRFVYTRINGKEVLKLYATDVTIEDMNSVFKDYEIIADGDRAWSKTLSIAL